jgi:predicted DNA-binding antitoxin AbrB/MazE fold protein
MITAIEGVYENGVVLLKKNVKIAPNTKVMVIFEEKNEEVKLSKNDPSNSLRGAWKDLKLAEKNNVSNYFDLIRDEWEKDI